MSYFEIIEGIPLKIQQGAVTVELDNGKIAYFSKTRDILWYSELVRQRRGARRSITIQMRVGHVNTIAQEAKSPTTYGVCHSMKGW